MTGFSGVMVTSDHGEIEVKNLDPTLLGVNHNIAMNQYVGAVLSSSVNTLRDDAKTADDKFATLKTRVDGFGTSQENPDLQN